MQQHFWKSTDHWCFSQQKTLDRMNDDPTARDRSSPWPPFKRIVGAKRAAGATPTATGEINLNPIRRDEANRESFVGLKARSIVHLPRRLIVLIKRKRVRLDISSCMNKNRFSSFFFYNPRCNPSRVGSLYWITRASRPISAFDPSSAVAS